MIETEDYSLDINCLLKDYDIKYEIIDKKFSKKYSQYVLKCKTQKDIDMICENINDIALITGSYNGVRKIINNDLTIMLEIPNKENLDCNLLNVLKNKNISEVSLLLGEDIDGNCKKVPFREIPHLLIGGATGSGKVFI